MKDYLEKDPWCIIERGFHPEYNRVTESIFSLGNGKMGQRGNFEEQYSGDSLQGNYMAGVYYPDKTKVGWWKIGYPEYFAKVLNATDWSGIDVCIGKQSLDLAKCKVEDFERILNMKEGYLHRKYTAELPEGKKVKVETKRFLSIVDDEAGAVNFSITPLDFDAKITFTPYLDGDVKNEDANYDEKFWREVEKQTEKGEAYLSVETKKNSFLICSGMKYFFYQDGKPVKLNPEIIEQRRYTANKFTIDCKKGQKSTLIKYAVNVSSMYHPKDEMMDNARALVRKISEKGFDRMLKEQSDAWDKKWQLSDIVIEGDVAAQQAIRFNIFQLDQTYTGKDPRLNIGPKGFTGEKYGGSTYWDTEAYCLYFYLSTAAQEVSRNLVLYRYRHLQKAIENAGKLGFKDGAALYPMVTMNGEESHNEWEITFEEIHRNGAMAYAIYNYINYSGDKEYMIDYGLEVLIAISRFWKQRVNFSTEKQKYVMLGVTGPNEYENNINNNWYTSLIAQWTLKYTLESIEHLKSKAAEKYKKLIAKTGFKEEQESNDWKEIIDKIYLPEDKERSIFLQQEGYLDKELLTAEDIPEEEKPINQNWSWDRILRSCFIKQADVLQGLFFFEQDYDRETIKRNYDFYEPKTVHESSLSPCVHAIIAARLGYRKKAYDFYLRTARLDLDDYNNDTEDGCHITSMAGTWMSLVYGFGGMRIKDGQLCFQPFIPGKWKHYSFKIFFRGILLKIKVDAKHLAIRNESEKALKLNVWDMEYELRPGSEIHADINENGLDQ